MSETKSYYDTYWTSEGFNPQGHIAAWQQSLFEKEIPSAGACLDLGCGDGGTSGLFLNSHGYAYVGADISETAVEQAISHGLNAVVIQDASTLPFENDRFDGVIFFEVIEHLFDVEAVLCEIRRVLKPGGVLLLTTPNICYWRRRVDLLLGRWNPHGDNLSIEQPWRDPHIRFFNPEVLDACLNKCGFGSVTTGAVGGAFLRHLPLVGRWFPNRTSVIYRCLERSWPSLFGYRLVTTARKEGSLENGGGSLSR